MQGAHDCSLLALTELEGGWAGPCSTRDLTLVSSSLCTDVEWSGALGSVQGASDTETQNGALGLCPSMRPCLLRRPTSGGEGRGSDGAWNQRQTLCLGGKTPLACWESRPKKRWSWLPSLSRGSSDGACVGSQLLCSRLAHQRQETWKQTPGSRGKTTPRDEHACRLPSPFRAVVSSHFWAHEAL